VIAAGIRDHAATTFVLTQRSDFVICAAQFEGADGLQVLELEEELALFRRACPFEQWSADGDAVEARTSLLNVS
jgi:hypothetical protein